ncbi:CBS domain-containing protein [Oceanospirillum sediminis]|uniref:CBS domain-containing protein n=1 Tax=Oceanospirillum sediminis TaxID=2760088 RepID=A0A839IW07_9GAMM|nr:CBS domain-containing protein [Oceanospirillum sediminis]MBB1488942.1 CBS domain-containing protein [Oceanospirillum sediminis]
MLKSVRVSDYMPDLLIRFTPDMNIFSAIDQMLEHKISGAPVVDAKGELIGILSQRDCLQNVIKGSFYDDSADTVAHYMTSEVDTILSDEDVVSVAQKMIRSNRRRFPVMDDTGHLVGMITLADILRVIRDFAEHRN